MPSRSNPQPKQTRFKNKKESSPLARSLGAECDRSARFCFPPTRPWCFGSGRTFAAITGTQE